MTATKKRWIASTISLVVCFAMLIGTTFAWFTDKVTSGKNAIIAGNLDVELTHTNNTVTDEKVEGKTDLFPVSLWEPGVIAYENFTVANVGNLALKYAMNLNISAKNALNGKDLSQVILASVVKDGFNPTGDAAAKRTAAQGLEFTTLADFSKNGNLTAKGGAHDNDVYGVVLYWKPTDHDNDYNVNNGQKTDDNKDALFIDFGVELVATQDTVEADSFDKNYDIEAPWMGGVADVPAEVEGVITINSAEELAGFAKSVNSVNTYSGKTIKLGKDIDLNNISWTPISVFNGTFDGQNHTILNLVVSGEKKVGLFGQVGGTVENLNVDGAKVQGINAVGTVCGLSYYGDIINCTVKNATVTSRVKNNDDGDKVGGVVGRLSVEEGTGSVKNCTAENVTVQGLRQVGGVLGGAYKTSGSYDVSGNTAKDSTIIFDKSNAYSTYATMTDVREVIGTPEALNSANTATNVTILTMEQDGLIKDAAGNYSIANTTGMRAFANMVNGGTTFAGKTVSLENDIDLAGIAWTPMSGPDTNRDFSGTFDGKNHTIKNMKVTDYTGDYIGFFSKVTGATIKNLKFTNATLTNAASSGYGARGGVVVGWAYACNIDNCHVENATITGYQKVGGILGCLSVESASGPNSVTNCSVKNLTMSASCESEPVLYQSAGLVGYISYNGSNANGVLIENNSVENITINNDCGDQGNVKYYNGAFIGTIVRDQSGTNGKIVLKGNTVSGTNTSVFNNPAYSSTYFGWATTTGAVVPIMIDGVAWTPAE